jgi:DNA repair protein RadA/Sms
MKLNIEVDGLEKGTNVLDIDVPDHMRRRVFTKLDWLDDVLGEQGIVPSQAILFTGTPGAGKTTTMLQLADILTKKGAVALFNTREESLYQVKMTAERLKLKSGFYVGQDEMTDEVIEHSRHIIDKNPKKDFFLIVDSLQTLNDGKYGPGMVNGQSAVRVTECLVDFCKRGHNGIYPILFCVGQVNKDGSFSGRNVIKHAVDTHLHLYIDGEKKSDTYGERLFECQKNRFGFAGRKLILGVGETGVYKKEEILYENS